ncbi:ion transporter [Candidatus Peregrinibacteria bacterium]|nr:ion transporter [Candidatus Peregrinibacteria bacterium]
MRQPRNLTLGFQYRLDRFLHEGFANEESKTYRVINDVVVFLIFFSIASIVIASVEEIYLQYQTFFDVSEYIVVGIFTFEYIANIYVAQKKSSYIFGIWGVIDFLAIAPSYLNIADFRAVKMLRVLRILRFLRLMRMLRLLKLAKHATKEYAKSKASKFDTLKMDLQIYFIALFSVLVIFSTLEYYAEKGVEGTAFTSIPKAMWWGIVTITTVGYGDMYPVTVIGRIVAAFTMLAGLALFGLLMNVIGKSMMSSLFGTTDLENVDVSTKEAKK